MATTQNLSDWRGKDLLYSDGEKIGKLEDVYVDGETEEPQFGTVKEGPIGTTPRVYGAGYLINRPTVFTCLVFG